MLLFLERGVLVFIREVEVSARRRGCEILRVTARVGVCNIAVDWAGDDRRVLGLGLLPGFVLVQPGSEVQFEIIVAPGGVVRWASTQPVLRPIILIIAIGRIIFLPSGFGPVW